MNEEKSAKKILVIDDEPIIVKMLESRLKANGYEVITATDGQEGLNAARSQNPDLIILDLMLPKIDGYRFCRLMKLDDNHKHIPIVMFTARVQKEDEKMGLDAEADAYITKPFDPKTLLDKLRELLNK